MIEDLVAALAAIKAGMKALEEKEEEVKARLSEEMLEAGLSSINSNEGSVRLQSRVEKIYGKEIKEMEAALKQAKKLADDMGDYEEGKTKTSIAFNFPKVSS